MHFPAIFRIFESNSETILFKFERFKITFWFTFVYISIICLPMSWYFPVSNQISCHIFKCYSNNFLMLFDTFSMVLSIFYESHPLIKGKQNKQYYSVKRIFHFAAIVLCCIFVNFGQDDYKAVNEQYRFVCQANQVFLGLSDPRACSHSHCGRF